MCGVPVERADDYLQRLIGLGHRVAVCEQMEDPAEAKKRGAKSVVRRDVVRLVTPGTITEENLLEPARANLLVAVSRRRAGEDAWCYGLAAIDISTGSFSLSESDVTGLMAEIARLEPREIVLADTILDDPDLRGFWRDTAIPLCPLPRDGARSRSGRTPPARLSRRLPPFYCLRGFHARRDRCGRHGPWPMSNAPRSLRVRRCSPPVRDLPTATLVIGCPATRANLEITARSRGSVRVRCSPPSIVRSRRAGPGCWPSGLAGPSTDLAVIGRRLDGARLLREGCGPARAPARDLVASSPVLRSRT